MSVSLRYTSGTDTSSYSVAVSMMCAQEPDAPDPPSVIIQNLDQIAIEWNPPAYDGGSPILGYQVEMKETTEASYTLIYDGSENPNGKMLEITSYNSASLQVATYNIRVYAVNWIGTSLSSTDLVVILATETSVIDSVVSGTGIGTIQAFVDAYVDVLAKDSSGNDIGHGGDIFSLEVSNHCEVTDNFECVEVDSDTNILDGKILKTMTDNGDGTYSSSYIVPLNGEVTVSVFLLQVGGAYVEYFENLYMDGTPAVSKIDPRIDHDWGTGLITNSATDFVSARWYAKVKALYTEDVLFILEADDGVRLYFNGELKIDRWDTCCEDQIFTTTLSAGTFYDIKIDYKEEQGSAAIKLYWSSLSIPKEIIPSSNLYYPRYVGSSPYQVTADTGPSISNKCTASGDGLEFATVGKLASIDIISRDYASTPLDNMNDNYELYLSNNDGSSIGNLYFTASYVGSVGLYGASYIPLKPGTFTLTITLRGDEIYNSPWEVTIDPLTEPSAEFSLTDITTPITITAGSTYSFIFTAYDLFDTAITVGGEEESIAIMAYFQDASAYDSPIGVADLDNWEEVLGYNIAGSVEDLGDGTYECLVTIMKAAEFTMEVNVNDVPLTGSPFSPLYVVPAEIYAPQCVGTAPTSVVSGVTSSFQVQGRDYYSNNVNSLITSASSTLVELRSASDNSLIVTGSIVDDAAGTGVFLVSFTPTLAGDQLLYVTIEGLPIKGSPFELTTGSETTVNLASTTITSFSYDYLTGDYIKFVIEARDSYGNLYSLTTQTFTVTLTDADSIATTLTPVSNGDGTYNVSYQFTKVSTYTLTVNDATDTNPVASSPYTGISVTPGRVQAYWSEFVSPANPISAGDTITYQIQGRDIYSNNIIEDKSDHTFFISLMDSEGVITQTNSTFEFGLYNTDITLEKSGNYDMIIGLTRNGGLRATYFKTISFYSGIDLLSTYYHTSVEPQYYTQVDEVVDIDSGNLEVLAGMPAQYFSIRWEGYMKAPHSGKFRFYVEATDYNTINLDLGNADLIALNTSASGVIHSAREYYSDYILTADSVYSLTLEYVEKIGTSEVKLFWESDEIEKQLIPPEYLFNTLYSQYTPITLVVEPLDTNEEHVVITGEYAQAVSGIAETISIEARDIYDNLQIHQNDIFTVTIVNTFDSTTYTGVVTALSNGMYEATYTIDGSGVYEMTIQLQVNGTGSLLTVAGSPFMITTGDSLTDPALTQMTGAALTDAIAGDIMSFTVLLFDTQGNARTEGGDTVTATLYDASLASVGLTEVFDNNDGTYKINYSYTVKGTYTIDVTVNSDTANIKTSTINLVAGSAYGLTSTLTHPSTTTIGLATTFTVYAYDAYGNTITHEAKDIAFEVIGNHGLVSGTVAVNDLSTALYDATYTIPAPSDTVIST